MVADQSTESVQGLMGLHCTAQRCLVVPSTVMSVEVMSKLVVCLSSLMDTCESVLVTGPQMAASAPAPRHW